MPLVSDGRSKISATEKMRFIQSELLKIKENKAIDYQRFQTCLTDLCQLKHPEALRIAGFLFLNPGKHKLQILAANRQKALTYLKQAAELGDKQAILFFLKRQKQNQNALFYQKLWLQSLSYRWPETKLLWQNLDAPYRQKIIQTYRQTQIKSAETPAQPKDRPTPIAMPAKKKQPAYTKPAAKDLWRHVTTAGQKKPDERPIGLDKSRPDIMMFYVEISSK